MLKSKIIERGKYPPIIKKEIDLSKLINYEDIDMELASIMLNRVINENIYNTMDLLRLLMENYTGNMSETIKRIEDYSNVRFNCYHASKFLKKSLSTIGIETSYLSYKSIGFSSNYGDNLIKEAHLSLILPTIKDGRIFYIIFDPGLRIPYPIGFYQNTNSEAICIDNDEIYIRYDENLEYPYSMNVKGYNRYSLGTTNYECTEYFDARYETLNPEEILFPLSYEILDGYRVINYNTNYKLRAYIKLMVIDKYIECFDENGNINITYEELKKLSKNKLMLILKRYTDKLNVSIEDLINIIYFMISHHDEFTNLLIKKEVIDEKNKIKIIG